MSKVKVSMAVSLDGYVAGPNQSPKDPLGEGGEALHDWVIATESWRRQHGREGGERNADSDVVESASAGIGAHIMGRRMFGGGDGAWDESWKGWWGEEPPFHAPVFVLTHHERAPLEMEGGTTFTFVTDGIESALEQAEAAAGGQDVAIGGGASTVQQYLAAGKLDELYLHVVPIVLGGGERLLDNVGTPKLEAVEVVGSPVVTHIKDRVVR
jgi:dihydrofolate reductase